MTAGAMATDMRQRAETAGRASFRGRRHVQARKCCGSRKGSSERWLAWRRGRTISSPTPSSSSSASPRAKIAEVR